MRGDNGKAPYKVGESRAGHWNLCNRRLQQLPAGSVRRKSPCQSTTNWRPEHYCWNWWKSFQQKEKQCWTAAGTGTAVVFWRHLPGNSWKFPLQCSRPKWSHSPAHYPKRDSSWYHHHVRLLGKLPQHFPAWLPTPDGQPQPQLRRPNNPCTYTKHWMSLEKRQKKKQKASWNTPTDARLLHVCVDVETAKQECSMPVREVDDRHRTPLSTAVNSLQTKRLSLEPHRY